jgi:hypothetical protein
MTEKETLAVVAVGAAVVIVIYKWASGMPEAIDSVNKSISDNVTDPIIDWSHSAENPLSDDSQEQVFLDWVDKSLTWRGYAKMTNPERWYARAFEPDVALLGSAAKMKNTWYSWLVTVDPLEAAQEAADAIIKRRGG